MDKKILKEIFSLRNEKKAKHLSGFFKTGKGEYGEGDVFYGLTVPLSREIAEKYLNASEEDIALLLKNKVHEVRLIALLILVSQYKKSSAGGKKRIVDFYLKNIEYINNWDLVDLSAPKILGDYLSSKRGEINKNILLKLANSKNLWKQRIAIVSTYAFIKKGELGWTIRLAKIFLNHEHDLIHKATGWMLREVGKRDMKTLRNFLNANIHKMPRTMLRYAIERFPEKIRLKYLKM